MGENSGVKSDGKRKPTGAIFATVAGTLLLLAIGNLAIIDALTGESDRTIKQQNARIAELERQVASEPLSSEDSASGPEANSSDLRPAEPVAISSLDSDDRATIIARFMDLARTTEPGSDEAEELRERLSELSRLPAFAPLAPETPSLEPAAEEMAEPSPPIEPTASLPSPLPPFPSVSDVISEEELAKLVESCDGNLMRDLVSSVSSILQGEKFAALADVDILKGEWTDLVYTKLDRCRSKSSALKTMIDEELFGLVEKLKDHIASIFPPSRFS